MSSKKPVFKARAGRVSVAVWEIEAEVEGGEMRSFHTVSLERSYKDKDEQWQTTSQLSGRDIGDAIALLQRVQQEVMVDVG